MTKALVTFRSASSSEEGVLTYSIYDHRIAHLWRKVVENTQTFGGRFQSHDIFFGGGITPKEKLIEKFFICLTELKKEFSELLKEEIFKPILDNQFEINQTNLNIAHVLFEKGIYEIQHVRQVQHHGIYYYLHTLNTTIHRI